MPKGPRHLRIAFGSRTLTLYRRNPSPLSVPDRHRLQTNSRSTPPPRGAQQSDFSAQRQAQLRRLIMVVLGALLIAPECPRRACKTWSPDRASHRLPGRHGRRAGRKARFFDRSELRRLRFPKRRRSDSRAAPSKIIKLTGPAMVATVRDDAKSADRRFDPRDGPPGRVRLRLCGHADRRGRLLRDQLRPQHDADP
jgi:hypothetical protein